jgi:hypothetical protein
MARRAYRPAPEPLDIDAVRVVTTGTALWALTGLGLLAFRARLAEHNHNWWLWTCLAGTLLGLAGLAYCRRRRSRLGRTRAASTED